MWMPCPKFMRQRGHIARIAQVIQERRKGFAEATVGAANAPPRLFGNTGA